MLVVPPSRGRAAASRRFPSVRRGTARGPGWGHPSGRSGAVLAAHPGSSRPGPARKEPTGRAAPE